MIEHFRPDAPDILAVDKWKEKEVDMDKLLERFKTFKLAELSTGILTLEQEEHSAAGAKKAYYEHPAYILQGQFAPN